MRKRNEAFSAQISPFNANGGSLPKTDVTYQGSMYVSSGQDAIWQHHSSVLPICKYQGNKYILTYFNAVW